MTETVCAESPRHAGDLGFGEAAMLAHKRQHHPLVVVAHAALVGAAMEAAVGRFRRTVLGLPISTRGSSRFPSDAFCATMRADAQACCQ